MTFPSFGTGEIAPSAWANLVGDFHDDRLIADQAFGSLPPSVWTALTWAPIEDPNGYLQANNVDILLPAGRLYLVVVSLYGTISPAAVDYCLLQVSDSVGGTIRLRSDNEVGQVTTVSTGILTGVIDSTSNLIEVRAFSQPGLSIPAGGGTKLGIFRVGG